MRKVIGIGETVLDIIFKGTQPMAAKPGGSTFNALISLGRLGVPSIFISETGRDKVGDIIVSFLKQNNITTDYITRFEYGKSALALAFLNDKNDAEYEFYKKYPKERLHAQLPPIHRNDFILYGSFFALTAALRPQVKELLTAGKKAGAIMYYDPNFRSSHLHELEDIRPIIEENFADATIIRGSDEDFRNIYGSDNIDEIYRNVCKWGHKPLIYTMNAHGVIVKTASAMYRFEANKLTPISTIGAGDNFNAGVAYALLTHNIGNDQLLTLDEAGWEKVVTTAIAFSAEVCMSYDNYISTEFANSFKNKTI